MSKQITITLSDWVYEAYLSQYNGNRSKLIEEMLVKGFQYSTGETDTLTQKLIILAKKNKELEEELKKLKGENNLLKNNMKKYTDNINNDPEFIRKKRIAKGIINSGILGRI